MKQLLIWIIVVFLLVGVVYAAGIDAEVEKQLEEEGKAIVIIKLKDQPAEKEGMSAISGMAVKDIGETGENKLDLEKKKKMIKEVQKEVLKKLDVQEKEDEFEPKKKLFGILGTKERPDLKLEYKYNTVNAIAGEISEEGLEKLKKDKNVEYIEIVKPIEAFLDNSILQINGDDSWRLIYNGTNITGAGETICIIDTGIDYRHAVFGNCTSSTFLAGNCSRVIGGYDYINNDADPMDDHGHGTHCAGTAASNDATYRGVAPDAKIIAVKVLDSNGNGNTQTIVAGIDWCTNNASKYNISIISMSLGVRYDYNQNYCDDSYPSERDAINSASGVGIFVAVASGNDAPYGSGISAPACIQNATPVGGVNSADNGLVYQRGNLLNTIAPAESITSTVINNGFGDKSGTSMATPHVAGAAALLQQYKQLTENSFFTPHELEGIFDSTGKQIYDSITLRNYSRIDVFAAVISEDSAAPEINIIHPGNNTAFNSSVTINITSNEVLSSAVLEWNGTNESMSGNSLKWHKTKYGHGIYPYKVWGNDSAGNWGASEIQVVGITSLAPSITSFYPAETSFSIAEPENQTFNITADDPENVDININWYMDGNLQLAGINQTEWNFTGNYSSAGDHNITVVASDGHSADSNEWIMVINNTNRPTFLSSAIPNQTWGMNVNKTINLSLYFNDPDNDDMNFSSTDVENIIIHINNDTDTAELEPDTDFIGVRNVIFTAFDVYLANVSGNNIILNVTGNHIPEVQNISISCSDLLNRTGGDLTGSFSYYDMDDDSQNANETRWYKDSIEVASIRNMTTIGSGNTLKNQAWTFSARVHDGKSWSEWLNTTIVIENTAPETPDIQGPQNNGYYNHINITYSSSDQDNDVLYYYVYINDNLDSISSNNITDWTASDGYYSLKVGSYDNESISPNSSSVYFTIDTVAPLITSISSSGSTLSAITNEDATCRYSSSDSSYDSMNNMDSTGSLSHEHVMPSSGTYYVRCMDSAGNKMINSNSTSVTVEDSGSTGGGGGGGGGGGSSVSLKANRRDVHTFSILPQGQTKKNINKAELAFTGYNINTNKALAFVTITTESLIIKPPVTSIDNVYQYIFVDTAKLTNEDLDSVEIQFRISQDWLNNYEIDSVRLNRHTTEWNELETEQITYADGNYYYSAVSPGFSYFAITAIPRIETVYEAFSGEEEQAAELTEEPTEELVGMVVDKQEAVPDKWLLKEKWIIALFVFIGIAAAAGIIIIRFVSVRTSKHRKTKKKKKLPGRCPKCGSAKLRKGRGDMYCARCGTVISWD